MDSKTTVVISDMSIKNWVATSIAYVHVHNNPIVKTLHYAINITSTKTELFTIRCSINQAIQSPNINYIIVVIHSMHTTKRIFDSSIYLYQIYLFNISKKLKEFFRKN